MVDTKIIVTALVIIIAAPILLGYGMAFEEVNHSDYEVVNTTNVTSPLLNSYTSYSSERVGSYLDNAFMTGVAAAMPVYAATPDYNYTQIPFGGMNGGLLPISTGSWVDITALTYDPVLTYTYGIRAQNFAANDDFGQVRLTAASGEVFTYDLWEPQSAGTATDLVTWRLGITEVYTESNTVEINGNIKKIEVNTPYANIRPFYMNIFGDEYDKFYDYTQGWRTPTNPNYTYAWANGYSNSLVEMIVKPASGDPSNPDIIQPVTDNGTLADQLQIWKTSGIVKVKLGLGSTEVLGAYQYVRVVFELDKVTVYGLSVFPSMGQAYLYSFNSVELQYTTAIDSIHMINLGYSTYSHPLFRVDRTHIYSGQYPVISNNTLNASDLYPNTTSYGAEINHVDLSGSGITFAGATYSVNNGYIQVHNKTFNVEGLTFRSIYNGSTYDNSINGEVVGTSANPATITFNGTWSTIVNLQHLDVVTWTSTEWQPGEFAWSAFDVNFCMVGLVASVAAFIGLGMYGKRSGAKVGTLMLICGGAALIFLALI